MEFPNLPSLHCCETLDLLPLILNIGANETTFEIAPSSFMAEMKLSTEERLQKLKDITATPKLHKKKIANTFEVVPSAIIFQNFKPGISYVVPLSLLNKKSTLKPLRPVYEESPHFTVSYVSENYCLNVAPGMSVQMSVQFCAEESKDYKYQITFMTEGETFVVPVIAIGPRPLLDLPDYIRVPNVPVKLESKFVTLVRNVGQVPATFTITTSPPFFVNISKGILLPNQAMQLIIMFQPDCVGKAESNLIVAYESGEKLFIKIKSFAETLNVFLEKGSIKFTQTFIGLTRQKTILLSNNSQHVIKFKWKLYNSACVDRQHANAIKESMEFMKRNETTKFNRLRTYEIIEEEAHEKVYNRIYEDEAKEFDEQDQFMYQNAQFQIIPMKGEMWPNTTLEFTSIFSPEKVIAYNSRAYLEVSGREERLELSLNGEGIGAEIVLSVEYLNANKVYMCSVHQYEIIAINKGDIPGEIAYKHTKPDFGSIITCNPNSIKLKPSKCGTFIIDFCCKEDGKFYEEIQFEIKHSLKILSVFIEGEVICPLLRLDDSEINLEAVAIGYPREEKLILYNPSMVPIIFELIIQNDGDETPLTCETYASSLKDDDSLFFINPREVSLDPYCGEVEANSSFCVNITVTPNIIRFHIVTITLKMWSSDKSNIDILLKYDARVPDISCIPANINILFCFLRYHYKRPIIIKNNSRLPGYYRILPDAQSKEGGISYCCSCWENFLKPYEEAELEMTIVTSCLGEDTVDIYVQVFGNEPTLLCSILCKGQGPVVTIDPEIMDFGKVKLLQHITGFLTINNESPTVAYVTTHIASKSKFCIEPTEFVLQPEDSEILNISLHLTDPIVAREKLKFVVQEGVDVVCSLIAKGYGTSILCEPQLDPRINLGTILTYRQFFHYVDFTNMGSYGHKMLWSHNGGLKAHKESPENELPSIFKILPKEVELKPTENIQGCIEGFSEEVGSIEEDFYCYAMIDKSKHMQIIINCQLVANFVEPVVNMSKTLMSFRKDIAPDYTYEFLTDTLTITNKSTIAIEIDVFLESPFYMLLSPNSKRTNLVRLKLKDNESSTLTIEFELESVQKRCLRVQSFLSLNYVNHPKMDKLPLYGEVNYPTIELVPDNINFDCVPTEANKCDNLIIKNISPLIVHYTLEWLEDSFILEHFHSPSIALSSISFDSKFSRISSDSGVYLSTLELDTCRLEAEKVKLEREEDELQLYNDKTVGVEYYYEKTYEDENQFSNSEISHLDDPLISLEESVEDMKEISITMNNLTVDEDEIFDVSVLKSVDKGNNSIDIINTIFNVAPVYATLKPYECQYLSVVFYPTNNIRVRAKLACHILGGATEYIYVSGTSGDISFSIDKIVLDFGRQVFCMSSEKTLVLTNTGYVEFAYGATVKPILEQVTTQLMLEAGCLTISPRQGFLLPKQSVDIQINYYPGIAGEFNETFTMEIGYLPPVTITVHGYGVFPQVYLYLPKLPSETLNTKLEYLAIASLTPDYLRSLKDVKNILHYNEPDTYEDDIPSAVRQELKLEDWRVISYNDIYPSIMDIDLAVERMLLYQHIFKNPSIFAQHTKIHKALVVPNFATPPYLMDFGHVILDTDAYYTTLIFNYGPINAEIKLVSVTGKNSDFERANLSLKFARSFIPVGTTKELCIVFHPSFESYPVYDCEVSQNFCLEVAHGPTITVTIKAIVTVPIINAEPENLDFEDVRCGDCKKRSLLLHNRGHVKSVYTLQIQKPGKKKTNDYKRQNLFFIKQVSGVLEPDESCLLDVYFEPQYDGIVEWTLNIVIEQNPNKVVVDLTGRGMKPALKITDTFIEFEPVLPYVHKCEQVFTIENTSEFPVEIFFSDFDFEMDEEEKVADLIMQFYQSKEVKIPARTAGEKLPLQFYNFYSNYSEQFKYKLIEIEEDKLERNKSSIESESEALLEHRRSSRKRSSTLRQKKSPSTSKSRLSNGKTELSDLLASKDGEEIATLSRDFLEEFIAKANSNSSNIALEHKDPVRAALVESKGVPPVVDSSDLRDGVFIIFHGGPDTNVLEAANKAGRVTGLPVYSIDRLFLESLIADDENDAIIKLRGIINTKFEEVASEIDLTNPEGSDEYDEIKKKVDLLLTNKEKKKKEKPQDDSKKDNKSSKEDPGDAKTDKKKKDTPTFMNVPETLLFEILVHAIATFKTGVIIESLNSAFLRRPLLAFNNLLMAIGNVRYINFIMLSYTFEEYNRYKTHLQEIADQLQLEQREAFLESALEMNEEEFSKISPEDMDVFKEFVLESRKLNSLARSEALRARLLEKNRGPVDKKTTKKAESAKISSAKGDKTSPEKDKSSKTDKASSKSTKTAIPKLSPEEIETKLQFTTFENDARNILHTLEYWDRKACVLLKPYQPSKGSAKAPKPSKPTKESSKKLSVSSQISVARSPTVEKIPLTPEEELQIMQTGIPCWTILNAHKDRPIEELVAFYLLHTPELESAREAFENSLSEKLEEEIELFSVIRKPYLPRVRNVSEIYVLKDAPLPIISPSNSLDLLHIHRTSSGSGDVPSQQSTESKKSRSSKEKRKSSLSARSRKRSSNITEKSLDPSGTSELEETFTSRVVLSAGETVAYKVIFKPEDCNVYKYTFTIEMLGWIDKYTIGCIGACDVPQINMNPEIIFNKLVNSRTKKNHNLNNLFIKDANSFDFGPILISSIENPRVLAVETEFNFVNKSLLPCETSFHFYVDDGCYDCQPNSLDILRDSSQVLKIRALPAQLESTKDCLLLSIKNNPKIEIISLVSQPCSFDFNIIPKALNFEHIPINRQVVKYIVLKNATRVAVNWEFLESESVYEYFKIWPLEGVLQAERSQEIVVQLISDQIITIAKQSLKLFVFYGDCKCGPALYTDSIELSAETMEVNVECPKEIYVGEVKGKFEYSLPYEMLNTGKYNVQFTFADVLPHQDTEFEKNGSLRSYFKILPMTGVLLPGKIFNTKVTFYGRKVLNFKSVPIFDCTFIDGATNEVIDNFPLRATGAVFFSNYEFSPVNHLNFGYQMIESEKVQEIILKNTGKFEFTYTALSLAKVLEMERKKAKNGEKSKKDSKADKSSKASTKEKKDNKSGKSSKIAGTEASERIKVKPTTLGVGIFSMTSATGIIYPDEAELIRVSSRPKQAGDFSEKVIFFMSECRPRHKDGIAMDLTVTACTANINLTNSDILFREQYMVDRLSNFQHPNELGAHCVFIKDEQRLHFSHVMINTESTARISLKNEGSIPGEISVKIISKTPNVFFANPSVVIIENYSTNYTTISFIPSAIGKFYATLELGYKGSLEANLQVEVSGDGIVPEVALRRPKFNLEDSCYTIQFNPIPSGHEMCHDISLENVGTIPCQVILEICEGSPAAYFTLIPYESTKPLLKVVEEEIETTAHTNIVYLPLAKSANFYLKFKSNRVGECSCMVKLHIVNNPYETIMIFVTAETFSNDVIFSGLPTYSVTSASSGELQYSNPGYHLDFGVVFVNLIKKKSFKITNLSSEDTYRFEFGLSDKVLFIPAKGHLKPKATKDVIVTFFSKYPYQISKELMECIVHKIQYVRPEFELLSWDERQNVVIWEPISSLVSKSPRPSSVSNPLRPTTESESQLNISGEIMIGDSIITMESSIKTIKEKSEPEIEVFADSLTNLQLCLSALCNYSSYECSDTKIEVPDTLLFEKQRQNFFVTNTSDVCLDLRWIISTNGVPQITNSTTSVRELTDDQKDFVLPRPLTRSKSQLDISVPIPCPRSDRLTRPSRLTGNEKYFDDSSLSSTTSSLFSSEGNLGTFFNDENSIPFSIFPSSISILPNQTKEFNIIFAPSEESTYFVCLQSHISNLHPALKQLKIEVKATSLMPIVYFDLKPCDYLSMRTTRFCGDIADSNTMVVEFEAVGVSMTNVRTFNIVNPSNESFNYEWVPYEINCKHISLFHCHKPEGFIEKGKMTKTMFSFLPQDTGLFETFYIFKIDKYDFKKPFLLTGTAREPVVYFSTSHVHVKPTVIGIDIVEYITLKNTENFELDFKFKKSSLYCDGRLQELAVNPLRGCIGPQKEQQITITFHPTTKGEVCFQLKCSIQRMRRPLNLLVTAYCHDVRPMVTYESDDGEKIALDTENPTILDMKHMVPHVNQNINFFLANVGITGLYYSWSVKEDSVSKRLKINFVEKKGFIKSGTEISSTMRVTPLTKLIIKKLVIKLEIRYGPTYVIYLKGQVAQPVFTFSVDQYNFGSCLVQNQQSSYYAKSVEFKNDTDSSIMLECTMPDQDFLSVDFKSNHVAPKKSQQLLFFFHPLENKRYHAEVPFHVNSKLNVLKFFGEGVFPLIKLSDPNDKFIDLGCIPVGGKITKSIKVINDSVTPVDIIFNFRDRLPYFFKPKKVLNFEFDIKEPDSKTTEGAKEKNKQQIKKDGNGKEGNKKDTKTEKGSDKKGKNIIVVSEEPPVESKEDKRRRLIREFISFSPNNFTRVLPQRSIDFSITFSPTENMKTFQEKVSYQIQDSICTLCSLKGCSLGVEFSLDKNFIPFGKVVFGYQSTQKVVVYNLGQIGSSFRWTFNVPQSDFVITPITGYLAPGTSVTFSILFKPTHLALIFENKLQCNIDCYQPPLELTVTGACFKLPTPNETLKFQCNVRETDSKSITVRNPTIEVWTLTPTLNGQYFFVPPTITIEPTSIYSCEITYKPLTMSNEQPHEALIYINTPDDNGVAYKLEGITKPPNPIEAISRKIYSKVYHVETLTVPNWLKVSQIFTVITESLLPQPGANKTLYKFTGNSHIEVLPQSERHYSWKIYVLNEGSLKFNVKFVNETTSEYSFYEIALKVEKCPFLDEIKLTTCVRVPVSHILKLENPIQTPVQYAISSTSPELTFDNDIEISPLSEHELEITYDAVTLGEQVCQVNVNTRELGSYTYNFILSANSPTPESPIIFSGILGQVVSQKVSLENTKNFRATFTAEFENDVFYLTNLVSVDPMEKVDFEVSFEPCCMENVRSTLILNSPVTGIYIFPLIATCNLPTPQGPYFIRPGETIMISFKNPFEDLQTFNYAIEPAIFSLKTTSEDIEGRSETKISVSLVPLDNLKILISQKYPITGKLVIQSTEQSVSHIKWVYYLQGDLLN